MQLFYQILIVLLMVFSPRVMILLSKRYRIFNLLGPVFLCYLLGFILGQFLPEKSLSMTIAEILVPIAIPLVLFSADLKSVRRLAKPTLLSYLLLAVTVCVVASAAFFLFRKVLPNAAAYAGMAIGVYVGGTPNLIAVGLALGVDQSEIVLANTVDMIVGGVYFLLLISVLPPIVHRFMKKFEAAPVSNDALAQRLQSDYVPEKSRFGIKTLLVRMPAVLMALVALGLAVGLALLITGELNVIVIMLVVTTCGIGFSFIKKIRECPGSFSAGQYLIYMFSFGIGLSFDFSNITGQMLFMLAMFAFSQFVAVVIHLFLAKLCGIDGDTAVITSTAGIFGPAFIVPTADALRNKEVVLPGLICGILGYAIGNYLGIGVSLLLLLAH